MINNYNITKIFIVHNLDKYFKMAFDKSPACNPILTLHKYQKCLWETKPVPWYYCKQWKIDSLENLKKELAFANFDYEASEVKIWEVG